MVKSAYFDRGKISDNFTFCYYYCSFPERNFSRCAFPSVAFTLNVMSQEALNRFRLLVLQDAAWQTQLREVEERDEFIARVRELARERGLEFSDEVVAEGLRAGRRAWLERWI